MDEPGTSGGNAESAAGAGDRGGTEGTDIRTAFGMISISSHRIDDRYGSSASVMTGRAVVMQNRIPGWPSFGEAGCRRHKKLRVDVQTGTTSFSDWMYALSFLCCATSLKQSGPPGELPPDCLTGAAAALPTRLSECAILNRAEHHEACGGDTEHIVRRRQRPAR